jgi:hypothetical protein
VCRLCRSRRRGPKSVNFVDEIRSCFIHLFKIMIFVVCPSSKESISNYPFNQKTILWNVVSNCFISWRWSISETIAIVTHTRIVCVHSVCVCIYIRMYLYLCMCICIYVYVYVYVYVCMYASVCV